MKNNIKYKKSNMMSGFLQGSKLYFALAIISTLGMAFADLLIPQIVRITVDSVLGDAPFDLPALLIEKIESVGGAAFLRDRLWLIAVIITAVAVFSVGFRFIFRTYSTVASETLVKTMRNSLYNRIEHLPFAWHMKNKTGDIIQRCTSDVDVIKNFLSEQLIAIVRIICMIVLSLSFMLTMNTKLSMVAVAALPIMLIYSTAFHVKIRSRFTDCDENEGKLSSIVQENLTGVRVVRAFGREECERGRFEKQNSYYARLWIKLCKLFSLYWCTTDLIAGIQIMLIVILGAKMCIDGEMTEGEYIAFITYNQNLIWPVRQLGRTISELSKATVSVDRIGEIMGAQTEKDDENAIKPDMTGDIVFDDVSFTYEGASQPILSRVSFTVPAGKTVGILGGTGSGKSTLMHLLNRLYELPEGCGKITVGGVDIADIDAHYLRKNIGMVLQEPFLFSRSIAENIGISEDEPQMSEIEEATKIACLHDTVEGFEKGYNTFVGERGVTLSGGQKQRAAISRMLMQKAPILVFDDSLSAVDTQTDAKIRHALSERLGSSSVLLISHRITTLMNSDMIIVLENGTVAEAGTHAQLLAENGIYRRIYDIQQGTEETVR